MIQITIPGKPVAKHRPRFARRGKLVTIYSDQETEEGKFYLQARSQVKEKETGHLSVFLTFLFARPKSHFRANGELKASAPGYHTAKPDLDNLIKFALDILNGLAYDDDQQIAHISAAKAWAKVPGTSISIYSEEDTKYPV